MRKIIFLIIVTLSINACNEKKTNNNVIITVKINDLRKGTLYLKKIENQKLVLIDSIQIQGDENFNFELNLKSPEMLYLFLNRGVSKSIDDQLSIFAEPGNITINTDLEHFYANAKITGSKNHDLYESYKKINKTYTNQELELTVKKLNALRNNATDSIEIYNSKQVAITKRKYLYAINFAVTNANFEVAPYIALTELSKTSSFYLDTIYKSLSEKVSKSKYGIILKKEISNRSKIE